MSKNLEQAIKLFSNLLATYLVVDGLLHLLSIRLQSVISIWPVSAISYAILLNSIYASFVFLTAGI